MNPAASSDHVAERFYGAARLCNAPGSVVRFQDGSVWNEKQLYARALELNPALAPAYVNLALVLTDGETVLISGAEWDKKLLYTKAIECDPSFAPAYVNLSGLLAPGERADLGASSGGSLDRVGLLLSAIRADPRCAMAYMNLSLALPPHSTVTLPSGGVASSASLLTMACQLEPACATAAPLPAPVVVAAATPRPVMPAPVVRVITPVSHGHGTMMGQGVPLPSLLVGAGPAGASAPLVAKLETTLPQAAEALPAAATAAAAAAAASAGSAVGEEASCKLSL